MNCPKGVFIPVGCATVESKQVLTLQCLEFLAGLHRNFESRRQALLTKRKTRQIAIDRGILPDFLPETKWIRDSDWVAASIPDDLQDRRVEITGPPDRKMVINALNSGAKTFMADLEDSHSPTWKNCIDGQINLIDANKGTITFDNPQNKKHYKLGNNPAVLLVRPRGWHLDESHILVDGKPMSGALVDFGIYFFHNVKIRLAHGTAPYFYLAKLENHLEARLWNDVFIYSEECAGVPRGSIRATVLIETILAAFEMDEIIYELREHSSGLNCGRWDYMFSVIKKFRNDPKFIFPDRSEVGMDKPFLSAYVRLLVKTCHRRGVHAMGGMAAQIPIRDDPVANKNALEKVRRDKLTEVNAGHDGTWVAHPGLVKLAMDIFDERMPTPNQITSKRSDVAVTAKDLLNLGVERCSITQNGLTGNIRVSILYVESWLRGVGCVPIDHLMEDAATAEISRCQVWQWIHHKSRLSDGSTITKNLVLSLINKELNDLHTQFNQKGISTKKLDLATDLVKQTIIGREFVDFIPSIAYPFITELQTKSKI